VTRKIILATIGSMGDLYPFIAIARALKDHGFRPVLAVPEDHVVKAEAAGVEAVAVLPSIAALCRRSPLGEREAARRIIENQRYMLEDVILPDLASSAAKLDALAADAEAIVASAFFLAAPIIAEKRDLPLISVVLQPMAMLSPLDPPNTPDFFFMKQKPVGAVGAQWNRLMFGGMRKLVNLLYGRVIDRTRRAHGLAPKGAGRMFEPSDEAKLTLGCYSPLFAPLPADVHVNVKLSGFPMFDGAAGASRTVDPALDAFLAAGPAPLVFTLGTFAVLSPKGFYDTAAAVARRMGMRAVLLTGDPSTAMVDDDLFVCAYAPHSHIFPRAAAIVHHGGVGTTGQALRAGRPQLVVPHMGDQFDHAARIEKLGIGRGLSPRRFSVDRASVLLAAMLADETLQARAAAMGAAIAGERGAVAAAEAIVKVLGPAVADQQSRWMSLAATGA